MRTEKLRIGQKGVGNVTVPIQEADTIEELVSLAKGSADVVLRWATRGQRIEYQERTGARDEYLTLKNGGKTDEEIGAALSGLIAAYDPTQKPTRAPRGPRVVNFKATKGQKLTLDDLKAQLEAQGFKFNVTE